MRFRRTNRRTNERRARVSRDSRLLMRSLTRNKILLVSRFKRSPIQVMFRMISRYIGGFLLFKPYTPEVLRDKMSLSLMFVEIYEKNTMLFDISPCNFFRKFRRISGNYLLTRRTSNVHGMNNKIPWYAAKSSLTLLGWVTVWIERQVKYYFSIENSSPIPRDSRSPHSSLIGALVRSMESHVSIFHDFA